MIGPGPCVTGQNGLRDGGVRAVRRTRRVWNQWVRVCARLMTRTRHCPECLAVRTLEEVTAGRAGAVADVTTRGGSHELATS